ncbi:MAG: hypothetical protein KAX77_00385 [Xanthomonadales bacterium]|nr:hypothetical protein [Xanthomonadales bacterium]
MKLYLVPRGRGNWAPIILTVERKGKAPPPMFIERNQRIPLGGVEYRISKVTP